MNGTVEKRVYIQASPEIIYRALTDARELSEWFCDKAESDPREGGELRAQWRGERKPLRGRAIFSRLVPGMEVELAWQDDGVRPEGGPARHALSYVIRPGQSTTEVRMRDEGQPFPDADSSDRVSDGWNSVLMELKEHCEERQRAARLRQSYGTSYSEQE